MDLRLRLHMQIGVDMAIGEEGGTKIMALQGTMIGEEVTEDHLPNWHGNVVMEENMVEGTIVKEGDHVVAVLIEEEEGIRGCNVGTRRIMEVVYCIDYLTCV